MFALIGVVFTDLMVNRGLPWPLALALAIGIGVVLGAIHGFLVTRLEIQPFVVTLCGLLIYRGVARWYMNDATIGFGYGDEFETLCLARLGPHASASPTPSSPWSSWR